MPASLLVEADHTMKPRRHARCVALQALYEIDAVGHDPETTMAHRFEEENLSEEMKRFVRSLVWGVIQSRPRLDEVIQRYAAAWPVHEVAIIDRNILRMALHELLNDGSTPPRVVINEAVELAKIFGSESARRFVNGVLGSALAGLEGAGLLAKPKSSGSVARSGGPRSS